MDGNKICCVNGKFKNIQESPAGFGDTFDEAFADLKQEMRKQAEEQVKYRQTHLEPYMFCITEGCDGVLRREKGVLWATCPKCGLSVHVLTLRAWYRKNILQKNT
jgi:hypothetical protein